VGWYSWSLTSNVPVVYKGRDEMILMGGNSFRGPLEESVPEKGDFLGLEMASSEANSIWVLKSREGVGLRYIPLGLVYLHTSAWLRRGLACTVG
jgi:hypothetical protein